MSVKYLVIIILLLLLYAPLRAETGADAAAPVNKEATPEGMIYIPSGEFIMGSSKEDIDEAIRICEEMKLLNESIMCNQNLYSDETPRHLVYLDAFYIDSSEVTNRAFLKFVEKAKYKTHAERDKTGMVAVWTDEYTMDGTIKRDGSVFWRQPEGKGSDIDDRIDHPVVHMSWADARGYCYWAGKRLPTEAEWEKAARGATDARIFPWGNEPPDAGGVHRANYGKGLGKNDGFEFTAPVGSFPAGASPYGLMDMAGNVWEWVSDWYDNEYYKKSPYKNPSGADNGDKRPVRGGSWFNSAVRLRTTYRDWNKPFKRDLIGFRCAISAQ